MRPLHDEHHGTNSLQRRRFLSNSPNRSSPHLSCRTSRCPSGDRSANWAIIASLTSSCGCSTPGCSGSACPCRQDAQGKPAIHYTTVYKVFAKWADDGSLWQAFVASVRHLAAEKHLDLSVLHGDGTNTVAKKGAMALATRATNTRRARKSSPSSTTMATVLAPVPVAPVNETDMVLLPRGPESVEARWPKRSGWTSEAPISTSMAALIPRTIASAFSMPA